MSKKSVLPRGQLQNNFQQNVSIKYNREMFDCVIEDNEAENLSY